MRRLKSLALGFALVASFILTGVAQQNSVKKLSLEDLYEKNVFNQKGINEVRWLKDNLRFSALEENKTTGGKDIVAYDALSGRRELLISAEQLIPVGLKKPLLIKDYIWSTDNAKLLIFTNTRKVWRLHTRGDYWVLDLKNNELVQIGSFMEPARLMFAKFSPDGEMVGFVYKNNIYVQYLNSGKVEQMTFDGNDYIVNGTFDWAYEEEFHCRDGFRWSRDSREIAFWQMDTKGTGTFYLVNYLDSIYPKITPLPYPKVGTDNSSAKIGIVSLDDKKITWMNIPGDKRNNYLPEMQWSDRKDELIIQQLNRQQNTNKVYLANSKTGEARKIFEEISETWLEPNKNLTWINNGESFSWLSDMSGWMHLNRVRKRDGKITPITKGEFEVISLLQIDTEKGWIYYIASPENATERYLYRYKINGKVKPERLSPTGQRGQHSYNISPGGDFAIHTFSNHSIPPVYSVISLPDHNVIRILEDNHELVQKLAEYGIPKKEFLKIRTDEGREFDAYMIKPVNFEEEKKYPVIFYIYGEPASATVENKWNGNLWDQIMAQEGYVVISIDNRGTNTPRGREWRKCVYEKIGIIAPQDQAACAKKIMEWDFVDPTRIGMWGWSGGGSNTLNCMFRYPEIYKTGIAIAFISNQLLYDNIYQERYMNTPWNNEEGYRDGSPITHAKNLNGNLLLIHGSADDNCHYQSCQLLVNELIKHKKYFTMIDYPMRSHSINERENTTMHLRMTMLNYFKKNLSPGAM